jgi:hypothetical protein
MFSSQPWQDILDVSPVNQHVARYRKAEATDEIQRENAVVEPLANKDRAPKQEVQGAGHWRQAKTKEAAHDTEDVVRPSAQVNQGRAEHFAARFY